MATYTSKQYATSPAVMPGPIPGNMIAFHWEVPVTAAPVLADTLEFGKVPKGFRVMGGMFRGTDMDSSTGLRFTAGDAGDTDRLFAASDIATATGGAVVATIALAGAQYLYTADTLITGTVSTGPTGTGAAGTVYLSLWGRYEGSAS